MESPSGFRFSRVVRRALPLVVAFGLSGFVFAPATAASAQGKFKGCAEFVSSSEIQNAVVYESVHYAVGAPKIASQTRGGPAFISTCTFAWVKNPPDFDLPWSQTVAEVSLYYHIPAKSFHQSLHDYRQAGYHKVKLAAQGCNECKDTVDIEMTTKPTGSPTPEPTSSVAIYQLKTRDSFGINVYTASSATAIAVAEKIYRRIFKSKAFAK